MSSRTAWTALHGIRPTQEKEKFFLPSFLLHSTPMPNRTPSFHFSSEDLTFHTERPREAQLTGAADLAHFTDSEKSEGQKLYGLFKTNLGGRESERKLF